MANKIYFCLTTYEWLLNEQEKMLKTLTELGFKIDDYGNVIFAKYEGKELNAIVSHEIFTGKLYIALFKNPEETLLKIPQERISAIYSL